MRLAADFRSMARDVLQGKWKIAVLVGLVASMLGAVEGMGPEVKFNFEESNVKASLELAGQTIFSTGGSLKSDFGALMVGSYTYIMIAALFMGAAYFVLGSVITLFTFINFSAESYSFPTFVISSANCFKFISSGIST